MVYFDFFLIMCIMHENSVQHPIFRQLVFTFTEHFFGSFFQIFPCSGPCPSLDFAFLGSLLLDICEFFFLDFEDIRNVCVFYMYSVKY